MPATTLKTTADQSGGLGYSLVPYFYLSSVLFIIVENDKFLLINGNYTLIALEIIIVVFLILSYKYEALVLITMHISLLIFIFLYFITSYQHENLILPNIVKLVNFLSMIIYYVLQS